ncbi:hypothetical protein [Myxococcus qinghaiensis]|uniref:hypothetical protein n=1 Tax=Myxococcus qinghaiensis TaxID=2906758 RepID=UPI0020A6F32F|nr:hypothetical protein [Myxococcus qinghaiensis]MCP3167809.1 hypothetical protein [Myxococcus qinghaiensis]
MKLSLTILAMLSLSACDGQMNSPQGEPGPQEQQGSAGDTGPHNPAEPRGVAAATGPQKTQGVPGAQIAQGLAVGTDGTAYTIPGSGGMFGGGYLRLLPSSQRFELDVTCGYGFPTDNEAFFFANSPSVTTGTVQTTVAIDGRALLTFNDLNYNSGGQDRAFADTWYQGQWPWHGVFTANDGGTLTRWDITVTRTASGNCLAFVYTTGGGTGSIVHP